MCWWRPETKGQSCPVLLANVDACTASFVSARGAVWIELECVMGGGAVSAVSCVCARARARECVCVREGRVLVREIVRVCRSVGRRLSRLFLPRHIAKAGSTCRIPEGSKGVLLSEGEGEYMRV